RDAEPRRAAALLRSRAHDRQQALHDHRREPEAQLVEEQELRLARERTRDREHLLLAPGERADSPSAQVLERREVLVRDRLLESLAARAHTEVLVDGQPEEEAT